MNAWPLNLSWTPRNIAIAVVLLAAVLLCWTLLGGLDADKAAANHRLIGGKVAIEVARLKIQRNLLNK